MLAAQIVAASNDYTHLLLPSTTFGRDVAQRAAALLEVVHVADIMSTGDLHTFTSRSTPGNAITTVETPGDGMLAGTVRTAPWPMIGASGNAAPIEALALNVSLPSHTRFVELHRASSERSDLQGAARVVSGGRGIGSRESFDIIYQLTDKLHAAAGASRAAVDAGYCSADAIGISGAIQRLARTKNAGTIVSINGDPEYPTTPLQRRKGTGSPP